MRCVAESATTIPVVFLMPMLDFLSEKRVSGTWSGELVEGVCQLMSSLIIDVASAASN